MKDFGLKRTLSLARTVFTWVLMAFTLVVMAFTVVSVTSFNKDKGLFGCYFYIVLSDSMEGTFSAGDVIVSRKVDTAKLGEGDIITFRSEDAYSYGETVTHKIRARTQTADGRPAFVTYGVATGVDDTTPVGENRVIGRYRLRLPGAGYLFDFLKRPVGYFSLIFLPFFLLLVTRGWHFVKLLRQYRATQEREVQEQRDTLENERQEVLRLKKELEMARGGLAEEAAPEDEAGAADEDTEAALTKANVEREVALMLEMAEKRAAEAKKKPGHE